MADDRLDTGMKVTEVISLATAWWDKTGRHALPKNFNTEETITAKGPGVRMPSTIIRNTEDVVPAGILQGKPFDGLTKDEQRRVIKVYHHFHVRVPQQEGKTASPVDQVLTLRCDHAEHPVAVDPEQVFRGPTQKNVFDQARQEGWSITALVDYCPLCYGLIVTSTKGTA